MKSHPSTIAAILVLLALSVIACKDPNPVNPGGPDQPGTPTTPTTPTNPEDPYFTLKTSAGSAIPKDYVLVFNREAISVTAMTVSTNVMDWTVTSSENWCVPKVNEYNDIVLQIEAYGGRTDVLQPRQCQVRVQAGALCDQSVTIVQQSHVMFTFAGDGQPVVLPASGATVDVPVFTNSYQWTPSTNADWLKLEQMSPSVLRITSTARPATNNTPRSAIVTVFSTWDETTKGTFEVRDEDSVIAGDDYHYGDHSDWD